MPKKQRTRAATSIAQVAGARQTAEACAEWLRQCVREDWDFADSQEEITLAQGFTSRYRGKRYKLGCPACPNLEDQAALWRLVKPGEIGVQHTEGLRKA